MENKEENEFYSEIMDALMELYKDNPPRGVTRIPEETEVMLREMLELQLQEDRLVHEKRGTNYDSILSSSAYYFAVLDELGEYTHARKKDWCWWKATCKDVDEQEALEEFSDISHFVLSYCLAYTDGNIDEVIMNMPIYAEEVPPEHYAMYATDLLRVIGDFDDWACPPGPHPALCAWFSMIAALGYDFKTEIYEPYIKKNAVNQNRMHEGY